MEVSIRLETTKFRDRLGRFAKVPEDSLDAGGQALYDFLVEYHSQIDWKEDHWFAGPGSGEFAKSVVAGWQPPSKSGKTIIIKNTFGLLSWKTKGGPIVPKRAPYLTIPLIGPARHTSVKEFSASSGSRLFRVGNALCRKMGKKLEAVYALSLGVSQSPYPKAMPTREQMNELVQRVALATFKAVQ